jgi:hypothetical protein
MLRSSKAFIGEAVEHESWDNFVVKFAEFNISD